MMRKEYSDPGGRKLVFWDKLPGKVSIAAPGEGGYVFLADKDTVFRIISDLCEWYLEHKEPEDVRLPGELPSSELRGGIHE